MQNEEHSPADVGHAPETSNNEDSTSGGPAQRKHDAPGWRSLRGWRIDPSLIKSPERCSPSSREDNGTLKEFVRLTRLGDSGAHLAGMILPPSLRTTSKDFLSQICDVAKGVEYLHSRTPPICHWDVKSINILVNFKCRAVITDFGSAHHPVAKDLNKERERGTSALTVTRSRPLSLYPSPVSDVWALAWVAYEVTTNFIPFQGVKEPGGDQAYWRALALRGIGDTHRDLSSAIHHYEETAEIFNQLGETHHEAFVLKQAANVRRLMER
ncbi:hypothetical protein M407DRAFT_34883 [Tulasnella calospora MUT 4182]|uniref:Protein kinase domain-containing protein n=1 Tax=Tulasnella calospora MUT 4182 TaxID=1051891 RepID=A0A0C3Q0L5_9AGAM|nr:hypothetical protein M407DRAFT_34883 [Tulasnella calospora MUT 4182]